MHKEIGGRIDRLPRGRPKKGIKPHKRDRREFHWLPVHEVAKTMPVSVLPISPELVVELTGRGFQTVGDLGALTALHAIQIPGMNGWHWRTIITAMGRKQFPGGFSQEALASP